VSEPVVGVVSGVGSSHRATELTLSLSTRVGLQHTTSHYHTGQCGQRSVWSAVVSVVSGWCGQCGQRSVWSAVVSVVSGQRSVWSVVSVVSMVSSGQWSVVGVVSGVGSSHRATELTLSSHV